MAFTALRLRHPAPPPHRRRPAAAPLARCRDWLLDVVSPLNAHVITPKAALARDDEEMRHIGFTFSMIALCVKLVRQAGALTREEYLVFRDLFPFEEDCPKIRCLFALAWQDPAPPAHYARQICYLYPQRRHLYHKVLAALCRIASADKPLTSNEMRYIAEIGRIFGLTRREQGELFAQYYDAPQQNPHEVLGVPESATAEEIRRRYHALMRRYHPDRVMATARYPETLALAMMKASAVNAAYARLTRA